MRHRTFATLFVRRGLSKQHHPHTHYMHACFVAVVGDDNNSRDCFKHSKLTWKRWAGGWVGGWQEERNTAPICSYSVIFGVRCEFDATCFFFQHFVYVCLRTIKRDTGRNLNLAYSHTVYEGCGL